MQFALTLQLAFCTGEQCAYFDAWMHVAFNWTTWILQQKSVVRSTYRRNHANTPLVETGCRCTTSFLHCFIIRNEHIKGCFSISQYCVYKCFINMQLGHSYNFLNCVYSGSRSSLRRSFQLVFFLSNYYLYKLIDIKRHFNMKCQMPANNAEEIISRLKLCVSFAYFVDSNSNQMNQKKWFFLTLTPYFQHYKIRLQMFWKLYLL